MTISVPKEQARGERRIALVPAQAARLVKLPARVEIEAGLGVPLGHTDADFIGAGATIIDDREMLLASAEVVLRVSQPSVAEVSLLRAGAVHISFLNPFQEKQLVQALARRGVSAISMELIPRITRAQKLDALSSQSNLAGYAGTLLAASRLNRIFPMMTTAAGTIGPARVLVVGAGVAGLQAIATAHRLGSRVEAFDIRPSVAEQVRSLGARFIEIDLGGTGGEAGGYAGALTDEQLGRQQAALGKACARADVIITTAQVFGREAPRIVTHEMISGMRPGSVVVDLAVASGGNVEGSAAGETITSNGVIIIGADNLAGQVAAHASEVYAANLSHLIEAFWMSDRAGLDLDRDDEILRACLVTHRGEIRFGVSPAGKQTGG